MWVQFEHEAQTCRLDTELGIDLTISINKSGNVSCYYLEPPAFSYFDSPEFSGSLEKGGSVNCEKISMYAHASGTHTECALHVVPVDFDMRHIDVPILQMCRLVSVMPDKRGEDRVITMQNMQHIGNPEGYPAIIIRTLPNSDDKLHMDYSGRNPVYFDPEVLEHLRHQGFKHLLTDLPSIDRESDEGRLAAHKLWFLENGVAPRNRTITELIYVDSAIHDGPYVLNIQVPKIQTDAVPSRIVIYPCA